MNQSNIDLEQGQQPLANSNPSAPYYNLETDKRPGPLDHLSDGLSGQARTAFIGKVYILLTIQLAITFGICLISQYVEAFRQFQLDYAWIVVFPILLLIGVMILACCVPKARAFPVDLVLLLVFVLSFSYIISLCCSAVVDSSPENDAIVPVAVLGTVAIALVLTIYAFLCRGNYLIWLGIILVCASAALVIGITAIFTNTPALINVYCALAIVIFGIYLVIITKMIIGGEMGEFPMDHPILASLFLYMYIMRIFYYLLIILGSKK